MRVEFLLEEVSMANILRELLPKILPDGYELDVNCFLRPHRGKSDLQKSVPRKMKVFSNFYEPARIVIIQGLILPPFVNSGEPVSGWPFQSSWPR